MTLRCGKCKHAITEVDDTGDETIVNGHELCFAGVVAHTIVNDESGITITPHHGTRPPINA